jgi:uncharacterized protein (DUF433 family)
MISVIESVMSGRGLYTVAEAALYARMSAQTANAWFFPTKRGIRMRDAVISDDENRYLTFAEFAEAVAIRFLRHHYKVSLQGIRDAIKYVKDSRPEIEFPLTQQSSKIRVYQRHLYIYMDGDNNNPVQISGKSIGQKHFTECFLGYLKDFGFSPDGLVDSYLAYHHKDQKITMRPNQNMGAPMVEGTGFSAETLHSAVIQEGGVERAAKAFEVRVEAVEAAFKYWDDLAAAA